MISNAEVDAVVGELNAAGISPEVRESTNKHMLLTWTVSAATKIRWPVAPSDHRWWLTARAAVRRMLRKERVSWDSRQLAASDPHRISPCALMSCADIPGDRC
jgi:hypothetical protein